MDFPSYISEAIKTEWNVITGGPCTGKTTIVNLLAKQGYSTTVENARHYIDSQQIAGKTIAEIRRNKKVFQLEVFKIQKKLEEKLQQNQTIFLDRALPDAMAYFRFLKLRMDKELIEDCRRFRYKNIFILDRLPLINDYARLEDEEDQIKIHETIIDVYKSLFYKVIIVPVLPPEERVQFILDNSK